MSRIPAVGTRIDVKAAKARPESGEALMLDATASQFWPSMARTIPGTIRIPPEDIEHRLNELPGEKTIIAYCT